MRPPGTPAQLEKRRRHAIQLLKAGKTLSAVARALSANLERLANKVNGELRRPAVAVAGATLDPRPAYAAADIVVGMGGSALRGMAFGKPVVIVGERGFSAPFTPETADFFYYNGIYGLGTVRPTVYVSRPTSERSPSVASNSKHSGIFRASSLCGIFLLRQSAQDSRNSVAVPWQEGEACMLLRLTD
jgi:hypothetical protein